MILVNTEASSLEASRGPRFTKHLVAGLVVVHIQDPAANQMGHMQV